MDVAFVINPTALDGLGATLVSMVRNCRCNSKLVLWFLCSNFESKHKDSIKRLLHGERFEGQLIFIDFDARKRFGHLGSLHGDWTTYGRLLIPEYIDRDVVLYLDADLIISVDILNLADFDLDTALLAAVPSGQLGAVMEKTLFTEKLYLPEDAFYFNAGVLLINLKKWRTDDMFAKLQTITESYADLLISHDQTLLNALCGGKFVFLPNHFNNHWFPGNEKPANVERSITHFVGSPKPWDAFGKRLHKGYHLWYSYSPRWWNKEFNGVSWDKVLRTWRIRNSILLKMKKKIGELTSLM